MTKKYWIILAVAAVLLVGGGVLYCSLSHKSEDFSKIEDQDPSGLDDPVYITRYGSRYHRADCFTIRYHDVKAVERSTAESVGKTQCRKCTP